MDVNDHDLCSMCTSHDFVNLPPRTRQLELTPPNEVEYVSKFYISKLKMVHPLLNFLGPILDISKELELEVSFWVFKLFSSSLITTV